jgi:hypothetical protein
LKGDDSKFVAPGYRQQRNFKFTTPVLEISELLVADLLKKILRVNPRLSPYLFAGVGLSFKDNARLSRFNAEYQRRGQHYPGLAADAQHTAQSDPGAALGGGMIFPVARISLNIETSYRFTFTDYLMIQ